TEEPVDDFRSRFVIEPLEPGFGYTIGNSLRRTLLSSIPGAAVTSIRIEGVLHEFSTVAGVKEDVTDIILNLKELVVSSEQGERGQDPGRAVRPGEGAQRRGRGHRHWPVSHRRRAGRRPGAADRGADPHRPLLQLPEARGHSHRGRTGCPQRAGPAGHPELRR